jgi:serine/threonine protein kinase
MAQNIGVRWFNRTLIQKQAGYTYDRDFQLVCNLNNPKYINYVEENLFSIYKANASELRSLMDVSSFPDWFKVSTNASYLDQGTNLCCTCPDSVGRGLVYASPVGYTSGKMGVPNTTHADIRIGVAPGRFSFLGGAGASLLQNSSNPGDGWALLAYLISPEVPFINELGTTFVSPPPYQSRWSGEPWTLPEWRTSMLNVRKGVPPQYPLQNFPEFGSIESYKPFRILFYDVIFKNVSVATGIAKACDAFNKILTVNKKCIYADPCQCDPKIPCITKPVPVPGFFESPGNVAIVVISIVGGLAIFGGLIYFLVRKFVLKSNRVGHNFWRIPSEDMIPIADALASTSSFSNASLNQSLKKGDHSEAARNAKKNSKMGQGSNDRMDKEMNRLKKHNRTAQSSSTILLANKNDPTKNKNPNQGRNGSTGNSASSLINGQNNGMLVSASMLQLDGLQYRANIYMLHDRKVWARRVEKGSPSSKEEAQIIARCHIEHPNVTRFLGVNFSESSMLYVTEYCERGSLSDFLYDSAFPINDRLRLNIASDVVTGLAHIHNLGLSHGRLTSSNCVIDSHLVVKLTDFGVATYAYMKNTNTLATAPPASTTTTTTDSVETLEDSSMAAKRAAIDDGNLSQSLFYKAPELLPSKKRIGPNVSTASTPSAVKSATKSTSSSTWELLGTNKGDIYSLGILLFEVGTGRLPYEELISERNISVGAVLQLIMSGTRPEFPSAGQPIFAVKKGEEISKRYFDTVAKCWAADPESRPNMRSVKHDLRRITEKDKASMTDRALEFFQQYSENLQLQVAQKNKMYDVERAKVEKLLSSMIPKKHLSKMRDQATRSPESELSNATVLAM